MYFLPKHDKLNAYIYVYFLFMVGVQALRTVLNKFSVNNRKNMFVIKELDDSHSVYYLR